MTASEKTFAVGPQTHGSLNTGPRAYGHVCGESPTGAKKGGCRTLVQLRSRRGFLERLQASDRVVVIVRDAWERPIRSVLRALGIPDEHFDRALSIYNLLFDPREILDLQRHERSLEVSLAILTSAFYGALSSVSSGR
jgi:hypothetical protein